MKIYKTFRLMSVLFALSGLIILFTYPLRAQRQWQDKSKKEFIEYLKKLDTTGVNALKIELVTVSPGLTATTAFGHSALRIRGGVEYGPRDYYIDFGEYDTSLAFIWRFFRGGAKFYINAIPMASAYEAWDSSGRGLYVSEIRLNPAQKAKLVRIVGETLDRYPEGYEYSNFNSNCVTFIRDLIGNAAGRPVTIQNLEGRNTGRLRTTLYSDQNVWLRINENLLFDHDTDHVRNGHDLICVPNDLEKAVREMGLAGEKKTLIPNRFSGPGDSDFFGSLMLGIWIFIIVSQIPISFLGSFRRMGEKMFALISGIGGSIALIVVLFTSFDFMDETITPLVYSPVDFLLFKKSEKWKSSDFLLYLGGFRILMILAAVLLRVTVSPQNIDFMIGSALCFFTLYTFNKYKER